MAAPGLPDLEPQPRVHPLPRRPLRHVRRLQRQHHHPDHLVGRRLRGVRLLLLPRCPLRGGDDRGGATHVRAEHPVRHHVQPRHHPHIPLGLPRCAVHAREPPRRHGHRPRLLPGGELERGTFLPDEHHRHPLRQRLVHLAGGLRGRQLRWRGHQPARQPGAHRRVHHRRPGPGRHLHRPVHGRRRHHRLPVLELRRRHHLHGHQPRQDVRVGRVLHGEADRHRRQGSHRHRHEDGHRRQRRRRRHRVHRDRHPGTGPELPTRQPVGHHRQLRLPVPVRPGRHYPAEDHHLRRDGRRGPVLQRRRLARHLQLHAAGDGSRQQPHPDHHQPAGLAPTTSACTPSAASAASP